MSQVTATEVTTSVDPAAEHSKLVVVSAVGVAQVFAWGSTYYLPAVLAGSIATDTGWPLSWVVGALSVGLLVSGLVSPRIGSLIERHGGRPVLATSAILMSIGLLGLGIAPTLPVFIVAWVVIGLGMGAGLYGPAFSARGRLYGDEARSGITGVTLFGGLASTVCWPLTALLADYYGWRGACLAYAAVHLTVMRDGSSTPMAAATSLPPPTWSSRSGWRCWPGRPDRSRWHWPGRRLESVWGSGCTRPPSPR